MADLRSAHPGWSSQAQTDPFSVHGLADLASPRIRESALQDHWSSDRAPPGPPTSQTPTGTSGFPRLPLESCFSLLSQEQSPAPRGFSSIWETGALLRASLATRMQLTTHNLSSRADGPSRPAALLRQWEDAGRGRVVVGDPAQESLEHTESQDTPRPPSRFWLLEDIPAPPHPSPQS